MTVMTATVLRETEDSVRETDFHSEIVDLRKTVLANALREHLLIHVNDFPVVSL